MATVALSDAQKELLSDGVRPYDRSQNAVQNATDRLAGAKAGRVTIQGRLDELVQVIVEGAGKVFTTDYDLIEDENDQVTGITHAAGDVTLSENQKTVMNSQQGVLPSRSADTQVEKAEERLSRVQAREASARDRLDELVAVVLEATANPVTKNYTLDRDVAKNVTAISTDAA